MADPKEIINEGIAEYERELTQAKEALAKSQTDDASDDAEYERKLAAAESMLVQAKSANVIALSDYKQNLLDAKTKYETLIADLLRQLKVATSPRRPTLFGFWPGRVNPPVGLSADWTRVKSYLGLPKVYRVFFPGSPGSTFLGSISDFGPPVVVSFKFLPQEVVSGKHDSALTTWFNSIPVTRLVWWSYFHEPENDIEVGSFTAEQYRAAWDHLITIAPKRPTLVPTLILMRYTLSIPSKRNVSSYVSEKLKTVGNGVLAWDSYLTGNLTIKDVVDAPAAVSASYGLGFAIAEVSTKDATKRDQFVNELIPSAKAAGAQFVTWFESNKTGLGINETDWRLKTNTQGAASWKAETEKSV